MSANGTKRTSDHRPLSKCRCLLFAPGQASGARRSIECGLAPTADSPGAEFPVWQLPSRAVRDFVLAIERLKWMLPRLMFRMANVPLLPLNAFRSGK